jgi:hypothetical protein
MSDTSVLRLFTFRPVRTEFDQIIRDVMVPDLHSLPDLLSVHVGRQGPDERGPRLIATRWTSHAAMAESVGTSFEAPVFHPEYLPETTDRQLEAYPIAVERTADDGRTPALLRLARGRVREGQAGVYAQEVAAGTEADIAAGTGPLVLCLVVLPPDRFVTFSVWSDWASIERATGSDIHTPIATRHPERIAEWSVHHYEVLPNLPVRVQTVADDVAAADIEPAGDVEPVFQPGAENPSPA